MATPRSLLRTFAIVAAAVSLLAACGETGPSRLRATAPIPPKLLADMKAKGMNRSAPILVRVYKQESELELWKQTNSGSYALLKSYPICRWSGQLGPKRNEGDRQVPEGFYTVGSGQLNPNSRYYLSFDVGYPNALDRSKGGSGGDIMVHGACSSRGCFAMTDREMGEIYAVAREALQAGQGNFQVQSFPFKMTAENMAKHRRNPNIGFWRDLKVGADTFDVTKQPVQVAACGGRYAFNGDGCGMTPADPAVVAAVTAKQHRDEERVAALVSSGTPAVSVIYDDGGSNPVFAKRTVDRSAIPGKDRPYSTVRAPVEVALNEQGAPASAADATAAAKATYDAAETLLMSEALISRRPAGPQKPEAIEKRQQVVYARLMGGKMPPKPEPVVEPQPVVVAAAEPPAAPADGSDDAPFYQRWLSFASTSDAPQAPAALSASAPETTASVPSKQMPPVAASPSAPEPVMAAAPQPAASGDTPFYQRWLGLAIGSDEPQQPTAPIAPTLAAPLPSDQPVPIPPSRPRLASGKQPIFTSLGE